MNQKSLLVACALFAVFLPRASAIQMTYAIGNGSTVSGNLSDPGLVIKYALVTGLQNVAFLLDDGEHKTFDLFKIWTEETDVSRWEDTEAKKITATIDFDNPDENFSLYGKTYGVHGIWESGRVKWDGPATFAAADRTFELWLSDEEFNKGLLGGQRGLQVRCYRPGYG